MIDHSAGDDGWRTYCQGSLTDVRVCMSSNANTHTHTEYSGDRESGNKPNRSKPRCITVAWWWEGDAQLCQRNVGGGGGRTEDRWNVET